MSARPWKYGRLRKRHASTTEPMSLPELAQWIMNKTVDGIDVQVSRGVFISWYEDATPEELEREAEFERKRAEAKERWERETYLRLHEKYGEVAES